MKNLKALLERRAELRNTMAALVDTADSEKRAMKEDEVQSFDAAEQELRAIDETLERENRARGIGQGQSPDQSQRQTQEERAFADYVLGRSSELRADEQNVSMTNNGAIIPVTIADKIIKTVRDLCPILQRATVYRVKGVLRVPVWGKANGTHDITVGYQDEFTEIVADAGAFSSVELGGYLGGALTLIGRSVENNAAFSVTDFIVRQMGEEIAAWMEGQLLAGTGASQAQGALYTTNTLTAAGGAAITADELIELQASVKQVYQANACWTMHPTTFTAIKKLKDANNRYLLQDDITGEIPFRLLGKPVFLSDNMPRMEAGAKAVLYGDYSGLSVNLREDISIEVLREKYATQHAIGVVSWFEFDSRVTDNQRLAVLTMASA